MADTLYDYGAIKAMWNTLDFERVHYTEDETGWVVRLTSQHVCIANVPMADDVFLYDVCVCPQTPRPLPQIGPVIQRYYHQRAGVRYVCPEDYDARPATFQAFARAIKDQDLALEGIVPGVCQVQAPATCDLGAIIREAAHAAELELVSVHVYAPQAGEVDEDAREGHGDAHL